MFGYHGSNPIFFNKKKQIGRPEHSLTPPPPKSDNISFLPYAPTPLQSGRHMSINPKLDFNRLVKICVSFLDSTLK